MCNPVAPSCFFRILNGLWLLWFERKYMNDGFGYDLFNKKIINLNLLWAVIACIWLKLNLKTEKPFTEKVIALKYWPRSACLTRKYLKFNYPCTNFEVRNCSTQKRVLVCAYKCTSVQIGVNICRCKNIADDCTREPAKVSQERFKFIKTLLSRVMSCQSRVTVETMDQ